MKKWSVLLERESVFIRFLVGAVTWGVEGPPLASSDHIRLIGMWKLCGFLLSSHILYLKEAPRDVTSRVSCPELPSTFSISSFSQVINFRRLSVGVLSTQAAPFRAVLFSPGWLGAHRPLCPCLWAAIQMSSTTPSFYYILKIYLTGITSKRNRPFFFS